VLAMQIEQSAVTPDASILDSLLYKKRAVCHYAEHDHDIANPKREARFDN